MAIKHEDREAVERVCELLGLSREQLAAAATNGGAQAVIEDLAEQAEEKPASIVYPNIKFPRYKYREYPKAVYGNARITDVEETVTKLIPREGGGVDQRTFIRVIPDQFRYDYREIKSAAEEKTLPAGWYLTLGEAREAALAAKANTRPIVERPARGRRKQTQADAGNGDDGAEGENPMADNAA